MFLSPIAEEPEKYMLMTEVQTFPSNLVWYTFNDVVFSKTTIHKSVCGRRSGGRKRKVSTVTKEPLDSAVLQDLQEKCAAAADEHGTQ